MHHILFGAVAMLTQIEFNFGYRPFDIVTYRQDALDGIRDVISGRGRRIHSSKSNGNDTSN
jgi:hypothetical protein